MKFKRLISTIAATAIFSNSAFASGIPTVDIAAIAQSVLQFTQQIMDYAEQIKHYEQMLKDTANFEKQMDELGVDLKDLNAILGGALDIVNDMKGIYNSVKNIPEDVLQNVAKIENACSFAEKESSFFGIKLNSMQSSIQSKITRCSLAIQNTDAFSDTIKDLTKKAEGLAISEVNEYNRIQTQTENLKNAHRYLQQKDNEENVIRIGAFYDTYKEGDANNRYSQKAHKKDLSNLAEQLAKPNNAKQAQALSNSILLKILETNQQQYELNMELTKTIATANQASQENIFVKYDFEKEYEPREWTAEQLGIREDSNQETDAMGMPIIKLY